MRVKLYIRRRRRRHERSTWTPASTRQNALHLRRASREHAFSLYNHHTPSCEAAHTLLLKYTPSQFLLIIENYYLLLNLFIYERETLTYMTIL